MKLEIHKDDAPEMVAEIARLLQLPLDLDCQKGFMELTSELGAGVISSYKTNMGLNSILFNATFKDRLTLQLIGNFSLPLFFITAAKGRLQVDCDKGNYRINAPQSCIHGAYGPGAYSITFPANEQITVLISLVHRKVFFKEIECGVLQVPPELLRVVKGEDIGSQQFLFTDIYHLPAIDTVTSIVDHDEQGLLHSTHASAMIYENMFLLLNEYKRVSSSKTSRLIRDSQRINLIRAAEQILVGRLQDPPTIPELARLVGINQQSLKTGFRQLFGSSINQYVTDKRLKEAGALISAGELSIAEVASAVGYNNGGYFSRRFKEKYGVSPSKFS